MQFKEIELKIKTKKGYTSTITFKGSPLGRSSEEREPIDFYRHSTEIYRIKDGGYLIYVFYRNKQKELQLGDYAKSDSLSLGGVRSALKRVGIYPGPSYSEAVYHSLDTLQFLEKISE